MVSGFGVGRSGVRVGCSGPWGLEVWASDFMLLAWGRVKAFPCFCALKGVVPMTNGMPTSIDHNHEPGSRGCLTLFVSNPKWAVVTLACKQWPAGLRDSCHGAQNLLGKRCAQSVLQQTQMHKARPWTLNPKPSNINPKPLTQTLSISGRSLEGDQTANP